MSQHNFIRFTNIALPLVQGGLRLPMKTERRFESLKKNCYLYVQMK